MSNRWLIITIILWIPVILSVTFVLGELLGAFLRNR